MNYKEREYPFFKLVVGENEKLLKRFVHDPKEILRELEISEESIRCTDKAHEALKRSDEVSKRVQEISDKTNSLIDGLPQATKIIEESFGKDFEVSIEPFGIKFSEAIVELGGIVDTGTGTVGGTFAWLDNIRPDVDR